MSAIPMGAPGWPEFACCTASIDSARMALAICCGSAFAAGVDSAGGEAVEERDMERLGGNPEF